jgi:hypothetical protein
MCAAIMLHRRGPEKSLPLVCRGITYEFEKGNLLVRGARSGRYERFGLQAWNQVIVAHERPYVARLLNLDAMIVV